MSALLQPDSPPFSKKEIQIVLNWPHTLGEPVVLLMFLIAIEMEDALNEVLGEHYWIPLQ